MTVTRTEWTLELPWAAPPLTLNQRNHWAINNRIRRDIAEAVRWLAYGAQVPRHLKRKPLHDRLPTGGHHDRIACEASAATAA